MKPIFLSSILIVGLISILVETEEGARVIYYVSPTEPLSSCPGNSSCPPGQLCHTINYLVEHGSKLFSPDHINVTLIFMCGIHNYTKDLTVQNLHSFVMKGAAESKENVIIDHQFATQLGKPNCTNIQLFNISFVNITTLTMICPSISLNTSLISVKSSNLYGYTGTKESLSFINITGRGSQALLDNCTFKENCFIVSNFSDGIIVSDSTFQSYRHQFMSIIMAFSSVVTLAGNVNFTDRLSIKERYSSHTHGTAIFLRTIHSELKSSLNITTGATVYFVNLTNHHSNLNGGAVYAENGVISIGVKAKVVFMHNVASHSGGAVYLKTGTIIVGADSNVLFTHNVAHNNSGAILLSNGTMNIDNNASLIFYHNYAYWKGGAFYLDNGKMIINTNASLTFYHNDVHSKGGAFYLDNGKMIINTNATLKFYYNQAHWNGGALYLDNGEMIINTSASLTFSKNSATHGGAAYLINSTIHVDTDAIHFHGNSGYWGGAIYFRYGTMYINSNRSVKFIANAAQLQGGAIFIETGVRSSIIVDNSAKLLFFHNYAFQGGALYVIQSSFTIKVGYQSSVQFIDNRALNFDVGGAVYSEIQPAAPCLFMVTDYSAELSFIQNHAHRNVGHHMYGTSVKSDKCDQDHIHLANKQGKPYCWYRHDNDYGSINISFHPGINETLSPVSSAPWRVCLCDSNGKPQCANFSQIFTNINIYRGETFTLSACVIGYDFGTTVGIVHAGLIFLNPSSRLEKSQYNQPVKSSEMCTTLKYTVYSK